MYEHGGLSKPSFPALSLSYLSSHFEMYPESWYRISLSLAYLIQQEQQPTIHAEAIQQTAALGFQLKDRISQSRFQKL